jgi:hypothetical protein
MVMRIRYAIAIVAASLALGGATYAVAQDDEPACPPGSHFIITEPDGSTLEIRRDIRELPPGAYITAGGIRVDRDGVVTGGTVECIEP